MSRTDNPDPESLSRRSFMKRAGLALGTIAAVQAPQAAQAAKGAAKAPAPASQPFAVAVLTPESSVMPLFGANLLAGLALQFNQIQHQAGGRALRLVSESYGVLPSSGIDRARQLLAGPPLGALIVIGDYDTFAELAPAAAERRIPLLLGDTGANLARSGAAPFLASHSLSLWQSQYALGRWAAGAARRRAAMIGGCYESGYDAHFAFQLGFEQAGGQVIASAISHVPGASQDLAGMLADMHRAAPDLVYAAYSGDQAVEFLQAYAASGLARTPLLGSSWLADEAVLAKAGAAADGLRSAAAWSPQAAGQQSFAKEFQSQAGRPADQLAALGYDLGRKLTGALAAAGQGAGPEQIAAALGGAATFAGAGQLHLREVRATKTGRVNVVTDPLDRVSDTAPGVQALRDSLKTGWRHAYLAF
ncbi:MAG TPA: ABC transporter substrate-binding protein [Herpetosiphonaceae bacterium]